MKYVRWVLLLFLVVSGVWVLFERPAVSGKVAPPGFTVIHYWEKWTGDEAKDMENIVDEFNETVGKEKKIFVEFMSISQINEKVLVATAANDPPEVAGLWQEQLAQWAALNALEPLEDMAKEHGITRESYKKIFWDACNYNGHLNALVSTPATIMLHWNKEMFAARAAQLKADGREEEMKAAGFDGTRAPWTLKEFDAFAHLLDVWETKNGKRTLVTAGYIPSEPGWWKTRTTGISFGAHTFDAKTQKFTFTSPEMIKGYQWWASFSQPDWLGFDAISAFTSGFAQTFATPQNAFMSGKVAMELQGPWMVNFIQNFKPEWNVPALKGLDKEKDKAKWDAAMADYNTKTVAEKRAMAGWGVAPFPSVYADAIVADPKYKGDPKLIEQALLENGAAYCDFDMLVIPRTAKHKQEAFEFIAFVNSRKIMEQLCAAHGKPTPLAGDLDPVWEQAHKNPYIRSFETIALSPNSQALPQVPVYTQADEELGNAVDRLTRLIQTPEVALAQAQAIAQAKLDEYVRIEKKRLAEKK